MTAVERAAPTIHGLRSAFASLRARPLVVIFAFALLTRVVAVGAAALAGALVPTDGWTMGSAMVRYLARWDSGYYLGIAEQGRGYQAETWAFEPGYPLAIRATHALTGLGYPEAAFLVSLAAFLALVPAFYAFTRRAFDDAMAFRATLVLVALPNSFYLTAIYADGLFLACVVAFLLAAQRRWWIAAAIAASVGAVTRPPGVLLPFLLVFAVALAWWEQRRLSPAAALAVPLAFALPAWSFAQMHAMHGDWLHSYHVRELLWPNVGWRNPLDWRAWPVHEDAWIPTAITVPLLILSLGWAALDVWSRRWRAPLVAYALAAPLGVVYLAYGDMTPLMRYVLPVFTIPWMLAAIVPTRRLAWLLVPSLVLLGLVAGAFALWRHFY